MKTRSELRSWAIQRTFLPAIALAALGALGCSAGGGNGSSSTAGSGNGGGSNGTGGGNNGTGGGSNATGGGNNGTGGGTTSGGAGNSVTHPIDGAAAITVDAAATVNTSASDRVHWTDSTGNERTAAIVQASGSPNGYTGGFISQVTYKDGGTVVTCDESGAGGDLSGLGFMINHGGKGRGWVNSKTEGVKATAKTHAIFSGKNHLIYEVDMDEYGDDSNHAKGTWHVRWHYMFRTGNDYMVEAISYDFSKTAKGTFGNDSRSPYGEMNWSGTGGGNTLSEPIDGLEYEVRDSGTNSFIFKTKGASPFSGYTFNTPGNNIAYAMEWKNSPDREIGYVQTLDLTQWAAGGGYGGTTADNPQIGKTAGAMPANWAINYQLNGYQGYFGDKMTWQLPYGAAGGGDATGNFSDWTYARTWPGYPTMGYTVLIQLGTHKADVVHKLVTEEAVIHDLPATAFSDSVGTVVTKGPKDLQGAAMTFAPAGYNHVYHTWETTVAGDKSHVKLSLGSAKLNNQTFVFRGYSKASVDSISLGGTALTEGKDVFTSVDSTGKVLYATVAAELSGNVVISLNGG